MAPRGVLKVVLIKKLK